MTSVERATAICAILIEGKSCVCCGSDESFSEHTNTSDGRASLERILPSI